MSYQVIARKYRPQRFSDVVGQEHVTQTLTNAIAQNRIAHAYLFVGPRGTGKTTIARIFAKCLNCTGGPKVDFPDDDPRCIEITEGRAIDVLEIDGASNNGVEQVRELRETVKYAPASSKFKIYIIDEVHMLTTAAFNALLKTLEEPPAHVKFMFATTEAEKVLPTILSRCQRFDLRRIPTSLIVTHLGHIAKQEKVKIDADALHAIARGADGGMRDAESTLDQLISFCGDTIQEPDVLSMFGLTAQGQILSLARAVLEGDAPVMLRELNDLARNGKDLGRLLTDLLTHFRNLLVYQVTGQDLSLLEISEAEATAIAEESTLTRQESLTRILEVLSDAEGKLRDAMSKKIFLEVALLRAVQSRNAVSIDTVLKQLGQLKSPEKATSTMSALGSQSTPAANILASTTAPAQIAELKDSPKSAPIAPQPVNMLEPGPASAESTGDLNALWTQLLDGVGRASPFTRTYLVEAHPVSLTKNLFTIGFDPEFADHIGLVDNSKNHALLQTKLKELGHPHCQIKFVQAEQPVGRKVQAATSATPKAEAPGATKSAGNPGPAPKLNKAGASAQTLAKPEPVPFDKDDFKNDPLIQKALEVFKGQIVEVRS